MSKARGIFAMVAGLTLAGLLAACATAPQFDTAGVERALTPATARADIAQATGRQVLWGGVIVSSENLRDATQLEVLGFPVDGRERPNTAATPLGRFLIRADGYLETADYAAGRQVTVVGPVREGVVGRIGEAEYLYPVVQADRLHLWPVDSPGAPQTRFHFGIGVIVR